MHFVTTCINNLRRRDFDGVFFSVFFVYLVTVIFHVKKTEKKTPSKSRLLKLFVHVVTKYIFFKLLIFLLHAGGRRPDAGRRTSYIIYTVHCAPCTIYCILCTAHCAPHQHTVSCVQCPTSGVRRPASGVQ